MQGASCAGRQPAQMLTLKSKDTHWGQHTHSQQRVPHPLQCAHKHTHMRARKRACTLLRSLRLPLRRGPGEARVPGWGRAHLGSAPGRGRRSVANAGGRTWLGGCGGAAAATRVERSVAQLSRRGAGARSLGSAMVEAAPPGPGPLRRTFLVPEIKSLDQYDFSRAKAAASLAWVLRAAFGGAGTRWGRQVRRAGLGGRNVETIAWAAGVPASGLLLGPGRGLWSPSCGSAVGVGPAAQLRAQTLTSGSQVSGAVSARRLGFPVGPCLARSPPLYTPVSCARGPPVHTRTHFQRPRHTPAYALPALRATRGAPGTPYFASTAQARPGLAAVPYCPIFAWESRSPVKGKWLVQDRLWQGPRCTQAHMCEEVGWREAMWVGPQHWRPWAGSLRDTCQSWELGPDHGEEGVN